jgi:hypothetical protein
VHRGERNTADAGRTAGVIQVEGCDARKPIFFHWRAGTKVKPFVIQGRRGERECADFLARKARVYTGSGLPDVVRAAGQAALVRWALKGRAAIFADCGLGKTFMQVAWASRLNVPTLILAPLCVAEQTVAEAAKLGVAVRYATRPIASDGHRIVITNYERLDKFDPSHSQAVVLDESILKAFDGETRNALIRPSPRRRIGCAARRRPARTTSPNWRTMRSSSG